jgi:site-specific DNA-cytosine methylase
VKRHAFTILHMSCGCGGSALGTGAAAARVDGHEAVFENVGGVDIDPQQCVDYERLTGVPALCADIHTLTPFELRKYVGSHVPDVVMSSPPCKGFSRLLGAKRALEPKYQKMNMLLVDTLFLIVSAWDRPPPIIFFENVPGIKSRGAHVLSIATQLLWDAGYSVAFGNHDCGSIGNLAQHRQRWFMIARHRASLPRFIYHVVKKPVRPCGEVIAPLAMPGDTATLGPMHELPSIAWKNWVRLARIPAGGDWRDLPDVLKPGQSRREIYRRAPVQEWSKPTATVAGPGGSNIGAVADPRTWGGGRGSARLGVRGMGEPAGTVRGESLPNNGSFTVADPRPYSNLMMVRPWEGPAKTVIGATRPQSGAQSVADPRFAAGKKKNWQRVAGVTPWASPGPTVTSGAKIHSGPFQVSDPRVLQASQVHDGGAGLTCTPRPDAYRVISFDQAMRCVTGSLGIDNGAAAVADPRLMEMLAGLDPNKSPPFTPVIQAEDGTWHRPFTTMELAVLQSFPTHVRGAPFVLDGTSHTRWRQAIGNAVPPDAAREIGNQLLGTLLTAYLGAPSVPWNEVWCENASMVAV